MMTRAVRTSFTLLLMAAVGSCATKVCWAQEDQAEEAAEVASDEETVVEEIEHDAHEMEAAVRANEPDPLAFDPDLAIFTFIVFIALVVLLRVVAWDPIVNALAAREEGITSEIAAAQAKHEEAKALYAEHAAKIAAATDDVKAMLDEARRDAENTKTQIIAEARAAAEAEKHRAIREVKGARDDAIKSLAEQSAHLAIDLAGKVVKQDISAERQGEIVGEAISRLAAAQPSDN